VREQLDAEAKAEAEAAEEEDKDEDKEKKEEVTTPSKAEINEVALTKSVESKKLFSEAGFVSISMNERSTRSLRSTKVLARVQEVNDTQKLRKWNLFL